MRHKHLAHSPSYVELSWVYVMFTYEMVYAHPRLGLRPEIWSDCIQIQISIL